MEMIQLYSDCPFFVGCAWPLYSMKLRLRSVHSSRRDSGKPSANKPSSTWHPKRSTSLPYNSISGRVSERNSILPYTQSQPTIRTFCGDGTCSTPRSESFLPPIAPRRAASFSIHRYRNRESRIAFAGHSTILRPALDAKSKEKPSFYSLYFLQNTNVYILVPETAFLDVGSHNDDENHDRDVARDRGSVKRRIHNSTVQNAQKVEELELLAIQFGLMFA